MRSAAARRDGCRVDPDPGAPTITVVVTSSADSRPSGPATGLEVRALRALSYLGSDPEHLAPVSSPAYDLVTPAGRDRLAEADPHNIVRLILPRVDRSAGEAAASGLDSAEQAAATLSAWQREGVLERDNEAAL